MSTESWNIIVKEDDHIFTILDTQSQILLFTEIFKLSKDYYWDNDLANRELIISKLSDKDKNINMPRYMTIFKQIVDREVLIRLSKGHYKINVALISKKDD